MDFQKVSAMEYSHLQVPTSLAASYFGVGGLYPGVPGMTGVSGVPGVHGVPGVPGIPGVPSGVHAAGSVISGLPLPNGKY